MSSDGDDMFDVDALYARLRDTPVPPERGDRPLTLLEEEIWRKTRGAPQSFARVALAWKFTGPLRIEAFADAIAIVQRRHDAMWTSFPVVDGEPVARLDPARCASLQVKDAPSEEAAWQMLLAEYAAGFDLANGPLARYLIARVSSEHHQLLFLAHHIVCDFWTLAILSNEVTTAYRALCDGQPVSLPRVRTHNRALAAWQRGWYRGETRASYERFWRERHRGRPTAPTLRAMCAPDGDQQLFAVACLTETIDARIGAALIARAQESGHSMATLQLGALALLLYEEGAHDGVGIGVISANRRRETISLVSNFAVMLPLHVDVEAGLLVDTLLARVRTSLADITAHQDAPPSAIGLHTEGDPYRVVFNAFMMTSAAPFEQEGIHSTPLMLPRRSRSFYDLMIDLVMFKDRTIVMTLDYNAELIPEAAALDFVARYRHLLERLAMTRTGTVASLLA